MRFGRYEAVTEISSSLHTTLYRARQDGKEPGAEWVVKVAHPARFPRRTPATQARVTRFLAVAEVQHAAARADPTHSAPIHEINRDEESAWYVTRYYNSSVQRLVEHRVQLDAEVSYRLILRIHAGLTAFRQQAGRSHGNLKSSNILIHHRGGDLLKAEVALTDPDPSAEQSHEREDLWKLGEIIYQLVRAAPVRAEDHWPALAPEEDWRRVFGEQANAWRELCHDLLDPEATPAEINLARIGTRLEELAPHPTVSQRVQRLAGRTLPVAAPLLVLLALFMWLRLGPDSSSANWLQSMARWTGSVKVYPAEWPALIEAGRWLPPLLDEARNPSPSWTNEPHLQNGIIPRLRQARNTDEFDATLESLSPRDAHGKRRQIRQQVRLADEIRAGLLSWPRRTELAEGVARLRQRGWVGPAGEIESVLNRLRFDGSHSLPAIVSQVLGTSELLHHVDAEWAQIVAIQEQPTPRLDTLIEHFQRTLGGATNLSSLAGALRDEQRTVRDLQAFLQTDWAKILPQMKQMSAAEQALLNPPQRWSGALLEEMAEWKKRVRQKVAELPKLPQLEDKRALYLSYRILESDAVNQEWVRRRESLANNPLNRDYLIQMLEKTHQFLTNLAVFLAPSDFDTKGIKAEYVPVILEHAKERREALLRQSLGKVSWDRDLPQTSFREFQQNPGIDSLPSTYSAWRERLEGFSRAASELPERLAVAGDLPGWQEFSALEIHPAFKEVFAPLRELENIRTNLTLLPEDLARRASGTNAPLAIAWSAWQRLRSAEKTWLTNLDSILILAGLDKALHQRVAQIGTNRIERRSWLEDALRTNSLHLLRASFTVLPDDQTIARARDAITNLPAWHGLPLPPDARHNLLLHALRTSDLARLNAGQLELQRSNFLREASALPRRQDEATFRDMAKINFADKTSTIGQTPALEKLKAKRTRWKESFPDSSRAAYAWTSKTGTEHRLEFVRFTPSDADPFYLCTTELPVGLVVDWVDDWKTDLAETKAFTNPASRLSGVNVFVPGICSWAPGRKGTRLMQVATNWQSPGDGWPPNTALEFTNVAPPSMLTPINYLPAKSALALAEWMGFRLPKANEWMMAYATISAHPGGPANLRDASWPRQINWVDTKWDKEFASPQWPSQGVFYPTNLGSMPSGLKSEPHKNHNDQWLWFAPVNSGTNVFKHLVGNVAEYLYEPGIGAANGTFLIVGGSALSDPLIRLNEPQSLHPTAAMLNKLGYADVGLRLALEAELSPVQKFKWLVLQLKYVTISSSG